MKLSLSWILDYLMSYPKDYSIDFLVKKLTDTTAEIDAVESVFFDKKHWYAVVIKNSTPEKITAECPELQKEWMLPARTDLKNGDKALVIEENKSVRWASLEDCGSSKEGLFPSVAIEQEALTGSWKQHLEEKDTILVIDNKALTNRPDLWGHRGFAREIAALLEVPLKDEEALLSSLEMVKSTGSRIASSSFILERTPLSAAEEKPCRALATLSLSHVEGRASSVWMALRLARTDIRPHSALIDMTNYVMLDIGQPMHAFDAEQIRGNLLQGRYAQEGELLELLDGTSLALHASDYVIADSSRALSLAGIMGGADSSLKSTTHAVVLEAGNFHPTLIRRTATAYKKRTEAATRFEKGLDPSQTITAIRRSIALMDKEGITFTLDGPLLFVGDPFVERSVEIDHATIGEKIGIVLRPEQVKKVLESIGFSVVVHEKPVISYAVRIPSWRASKDVTIEEDVIEEIVRLVGYDKIVPVYPSRAMVPFSIKKIERLRMIKKFLAFSLGMRELQTYSFFDESFLQTLAYDPEDALRIANPLSEHWQRLVTSLVPHLLEALAQNKAHYESLRFFELQRVWFFNEGPVEEQECAGIWYEKKKTVDFYEGKELIAKLFDMLHISIEWRKPVDKLDPWYSQEQSAELWHKERRIGTVGKADFTFLKKVAEGEALLFELDANFLLNASSENTTYKPSSKYPGTSFDVSVLIGLEHSVASLEKLIKSADDRIVQVHLIDRYEKAEWGGKKSLTFRTEALDPHGTLTKEAIDSIRAAVLSSLEHKGGEVR